MNNFVTILHRSNTPILHYSMFFIGTKQLIQLELIHTFIAET